MPNIVPLELSTAEREFLLNGTRDGNEVSLASSQDPERDPSNAETQLISHMISKQVANHLTDVYREFAMRLASQFSERLRCETQVGDIRLSQPSYGEFIFGLQQPTCLHVVREPSCATPWLLELQPEILFPLLDRLLGGGKLPTARVRRTLTEIENRLVTRIAGDILRDLCAAWHPITIWQPEIDRIEGNPKLVREAHPSAALMVIEMSIDFAHHRGTLRIAMATEDLQQFTKEILTPPGPPIDHVRISVSLAETMVSEVQLDELAIGDVVSTDSVPGGLATIYVDGEPRFWGRPGISRGIKAVRIESQIESSRRDNP